MSRRKHNKRPQRKKKRFLGFESMEAYGWEQAAQEEGWWAK